MVLVFFFFKQKTAYEMRISDWSSDVCSSDLASIATLKATAMVMWIFFGATMFVGFFIVKGGQTFVADSILGTGLSPYGVLLLMMEIGRASCRERVCQYV